MKKSTLFLTVLTLSTNTLIANNNIHKILGITPKTDIIEKKIVVPKSRNRYSEPKKIISTNSQIDKLMRYTKVKKKAKDETSYGVKMGYKISKNISISLDVMAQVDIEKSYKIVSKEANLQFALSL